MSKWGRSALRKSETDTAVGTAKAKAKATATLAIDSHEEFPPLGGVWNPKQSSVSTPAGPTMAERMRAQLEVEEAERKQREDMEALARVDDDVAMTVVAFKRSGGYAAATQEAWGAVCEEGEVWDDDEECDERIQSAAYELDAKYATYGDGGYRPHTPPYSPYD